TVGRGTQGQDNRQTRAAYQNLLRPVPSLFWLQADLLVGIAFSKTGKADRRNSLASSRQSVGLSVAERNWQTALPMQLAFSPRAQLAAFAVANTIAISVTRAQGPAPSPLLSAPSPPPANANGRCSSFDGHRGSLCQTARAWILVSCSRSSVSDWRYRIRIVCMAIQSSESVAKVLIAAAHR